MNRSFWDFQQVFNFQQVNTKDAFCHFIVLEICCRIFKPGFDKKLISTAFC